MVAVARPPLAEVGEIKAAMAVEDDVVRRRQFVPTTLAVENPRVRGARIDPLDIAALIILGRSRRKKSAFGVFVAAIVAEVEGTVGAARESVRPAACIPDRRFAAVRGDAGDCAARDLAQYDRAVGHRHRALGKPQTGCRHAYFRHRTFLPSPCPRILSRDSVQRQAGPPQANLGP
jgi:hypothetical protein